MSMPEQDYEELRKSYVKLQVELESANQALYDCRRQVKAVQTIEAEYQEEIRLLQSQGTVEQQKLEAKVNQLEERISSLKITHDERVIYLENELENREMEVQELKKEIDDIIKISEPQDNLVDSRLIDEIGDLRQHNLELAEQVSELEKTLQEREEQRVALQETVKEMQQELESYRETLNIKREEIEEANTLIQNLKDDYFCVKSELDMVRSKPLDDQSRGNSLFAEVDDRRLQLQQNMNTMRTQYMEMKRERASYLKQIAMLRNENATLIAKWEAEVEGTKIDKETILNTYKDQIQTLNELIDSYKKELKEEREKNLEAPRTREMKFFDNMLTMKNEEIEDLRKKLSARSLNYTSLSYDLAEANRQLRKYNLENMKLKNEIGELKVKIQEMEMISPVEKEPPVQIEQPKSIVKNTKTEAETNKENENMNKKVQFTETTVEPQITDRSKRRGAKILISKPIMYS